MPRRPPKQNIKPRSLIKQRRQAQNKAHDKKRGNARQRGYTTRWQKARLHHLAAEPLCRECLKESVINDGTKDTNGRPQLSKNKRGLIVDHIRPHNGDMDLFWDPANWQTLCIPHHNSKKQSEEKAGLLFGKSRPEWLKPSIIPLVMVCGAPCAGKNTYIDQESAAADLVIDLDQIAARLSDEPLHAWDRRTWLGPALAHRNRLLSSLSRQSNYPRAWFIVSEPRADRRQWWADKLQPDRVVVMETEPLTCMGRIALDDDRADVAAQTRKAIQLWWKQYERRDGDDVLTNWQPRLNANTSQTQAFIF